jgi:large subunit ribosomal protein L4e
MPRKTMVRRGMQFIWVGAFAPGTVGGRRAHPPTAAKQWEQKINEKERRKAIRSALAATVDKAVVAGRGHKVPQSYPFALTNDVEQLTKTQELQTLLETLGLGAELSRSAQRRIRAGRGKSRGRKYKQPTGPLLVLSKDCPALKAARNVPGIDAVVVNHVNASLLAPGAHPGRLTLFTQAALERLEKEKLFM